MTFHRIAGLSFAIHRRPTCQELTTLPVWYMTNTALWDPLPCYYPFLASSFELVPFQDLKHFTYVGRTITTDLGIPRIPSPIRPHADAFMRSLLRDDNSDDGDSDDSNSGFHVLHFHLPLPQPGEFDYAGIIDNSSTPFDL